MFLYLISHDRKDIKTHTYIGCCGDFVRRLQQHNCNINGGPRITRRAAPHWDPVMILRVPADRKYSSKTLKKEWKSSSRGLESRVRKGFQLAYEYNLEMYLPTFENKKVKLLNSLHKKWTSEAKLNLTPEEWQKILNGENL